MVMYDHIGCILLWAPCGLCHHNQISRLVYTCCAPTSCQEALQVGTNSISITKTTLTHWQAVGCDLIDICACQGKGGCVG